jgi:hypothetical protein
MSAFHVVRDGATVAVKLIALLFTVPQVAAAGEALTRPAVVQTPPRAVDSDDARRLHAMASALDVHLLGSLADIRIVQTVRNGTADTLNLAAVLPLADERTERLAVSRDGRVVDLLGTDDGGCGGEDGSPHDGHMQPTVDEAIADLLRLPPGQRATIAVESIESLERHAGAYRFALPPTAMPIPAQSLLLVQRDGNVLVVVPPHDADGQAVLTLRPASGETEQIALGRISGRSAFAVPVDIAPEALLAGSVELEVVDSARITWTTLQAAPVHAVAVTTDRIVAQGADR